MAGFEVSTNGRFCPVHRGLAPLVVPVLLGTERRITDAGLAEVSSGLLPAGTVLLSSRAPIGYLAVPEMPVAINQGFIAMKPRAETPNLFLLLWARFAHDEIVSRANGSTFLEISKANFRPIPLVVPSRPVMKAFEDFVRPLYRRIVVNERQSATLFAIRDALLPKLLSGNIRVKAADSAVAASL
jgi:type I restriction enzyme S subunit